MLLALRCGFDLLLQDLEKNGHDLGVLLEEVRNDILREVADGEASRLANNLLRVLETAHKNISEEINVISNRVKKRIRITDRSHDAESSLAL